ncbi:MAG: VOC family protein [Caldicoprobacterales bacterium]|nr:VOC family protein [Clostridiales bacterium]
MSKPILGTRVVTQIGILVNDIEKACQDYAEFLGVENPGYTITDTFDKTKAEYKGEPCNARAKLAFFNVGDNLAIELIEPDKNPSTWREDLDKYGEGFHHIAFVIDGMKEKIMLLERNGMPLVQKGEYTGGRYAYIDAREKLKVMIELLEND